jgi:undecaprenyl-diphosphatase
MEDPDMPNVAVVAHSRKSFGGGLRELRSVLAAEGVTDPLWYEVKKSRSGSGLIASFRTNSTAERARPRGISGSRSIPALSGFASRHRLGPDARPMTRPGCEPGPAGQCAAMPTDTRDRRRSLAPLIAVTASAMIFAILLVLVRLQWAPLESVDHGAAARLNDLVAGDSTLVTVIKAVTWLGSDGVLWTVIGASAVILALRKRWRLAVYLLITGAGALVLDPVLKSLVGRLRPVVAHPVAHGTGNSFPSGHSLGSMVCYGAVLLVFLPAARTPKWCRVFITVIVTLVALIGISRILLGVHYISDVVGAWALGITWLGITAFAFEMTRSALGEPVTGPVSEGLEPEARADLRPAQPEAASRHASLHRGRIAAGILIAWVLILGIVVGFGELVTKAGNGNLLGDRTIPHWFAAHRTPDLTRWSLVFTTLGATEAILIVSLATCVVFLGVTRHWRPVVYIATLMFGELGAFLAAAAVVKRPRPDVTHLDHHLPTSAYPSGHEAATCCLYVAIAILVIGHARGWWRWLLLVPAIAMPVLVALSRMYRGEHHPTDILGSLIFSALWLTATYWLIKPNEDRAQAPARTRPGEADPQRRAALRPARSATQS